MPLTINFEKNRQQAQKGAFVDIPLDDVAEDAKKVEPPSEQVIQIPLAWYQWLINEIKLAIETLQQSIKHIFDLTKNNPKMRIATALILALLAAITILGVVSLMLAVGAKVAIIATIAIATIGFVAYAFHKRDQIKNALKSFGEEEKPAETELSTINMESTDMHQHISKQEECFFTHSTQSGDLGTKYSSGDEYDEDAASESAPISKC